KGDYNSGRSNTGDYNSGDCNAGSCNTGDYNSGSYNVGDYNTGNFNVGYCNSGSYCLGCFNTEMPKIRIFDMETDMTMHDFIESEAYELLLLTLDKAPPSVEWWESLSPCAKNIIKNIPNFNAEKFYKITGI